MTALRALPGTGSPPLHPVAVASRAVERTWQRFCEAHDYTLAAPVEGTAELLRRRALEIEALERHELARFKLSVAIKRRDGVSWLVVLKGGRP